MCQLILYEIHTLGTRIFYINDHPTNFYEILEEFNERSPI